MTHSEIYRYLLCITLKKAFKEIQICFYIFRLRAHSKKYIFLFMYYGEEHYLDTYIVNLESDHNSMKFYEHIYLYI